MLNKRQTELQNTSEKRTKRKKKKEKKSEKIKVKRWEKFRSASKKNGKNHKNWEIFLEKKTENSEMKQKIKTLLEQNEKCWRKKSI